MTILVSARRAFEYGLSGRLFYRRGEFRFRVCSEGCIGSPMSFPSNFSGAASGFRPKVTDQPIYRVEISSARHSKRIMFF